MVQSFRGGEKYNMTLDSILNVIIPDGIFIFLGVIIYNKAKKPIDAFFATVKGWFQQKDDDGGDSGRSSDHQEYKISYQGGDY